MDGKVFEIRMSEAIQTCLPEIEHQLKRIADALEAANKVTTNEKMGK